MPLPFSLGYLPSGIYVDASLDDALPALRRQMARRQAAPLIIAGGTITTKPEFLRAWATTFGFPDYFGMNWDAFYDCAFDLSGLPPGDQLIVYDQFNPFALAAPSDWAIALRIFPELSTAWRSEPRRVIVLFRGSPSLAPSLPLAVVS